MASRMQGDGKGMSASDAIKAKFIRDFKAGKLNVSKNEIASIGKLGAKAGAMALSTASRMLKAEKVHKYQTQAQRGVTTTVRPKTVTPNGKAQGKKQIKDPKPIVQPRRPNPGRGTSPISVTNRQGLKTTTGQRRVKVSDADAKEVAKESRNRPTGARARYTPRGSSSSLTPNEKRGITEVDTILHKRPLEPRSKKEMAEAKREGTRWLFEKRLQPPTRPKPARNLSPQQAKLQENLKKEAAKRAAAAEKKKNAKLPSHKVGVKIMRKKLHNSGTTKKEVHDKDYTVTEKNFRGKEYEVRKSEIDELKMKITNAAKNPNNSTAPASRAHEVALKRKAVEKVDNPPRLADGRTGERNIELREKRLQRKYASADYDAIENQRNRAALLAEIIAKIKKSKTPNRLPNETERKLIAQVRRDKNRPHIPRSQDPKHAGKPKPNADKYEGPPYTDSWATRQVTKDVKEGIAEANRVQKARLTAKDKKAASKSEVAKVDKTLAARKNVRTARKAVPRPRATLSRTRPTGK